MVRQGRTFLHQLYDLLHLHRAPFHLMCLNVTVKAGLAWWTCFLQDWNGSSFFPLSSPSVHAYSDASGTFGCGAVVESLGWFQVKWPSTWTDIDISLKELVPVVLAAALWGRLWSKQHICFHSDNMAVVSVLTTMTAKVPLLMHLLRCLSLFSAYFSFTFSAKHIPGALNSAADALSRNNLALFSSLFPRVQQHGIPSCLMDLVIHTRPDWGSPTWT